MKKEIKKITTLVEAKKEITKLKTELTKSAKNWDKYLEDINRAWGVKINSRDKHIENLTKQIQVLDLKCQEYEIQLSRKWWQLWK